MLSESTKQQIRDLLIQRELDGFTRGLFTDEQLDTILASLDELADWLAQNKPERIARADAALNPEERFSERDVLAIAYVDHVRGGNAPAAQRLQRFFNHHLAGLYSHLHVLPHFPSPKIHPELEGPSSRADGGFEAMSYEMDPAYGKPSDLEAIEATLMFDFVLNHLSASGEWFQRFLEDDPEFRDFFVTVPEHALADLDLSGVFRPRAHHPVITFENTRGKKKHVWCTFSAGQADLNLKNPKVFAEVMRALVRDFVGAGGAWVRLDAVGYAIKMLGLAPKEPKTDCFGIAETHAVIKAMNRILADVSPSATLVAEVNATKDVIATYYGDGDEAHIAYEFPIAPLSLFSIYTEDCTAISEWSHERLAHPERIGLAFTASHDGIGVLSMRDVPARPSGQSALDYLVEEVTRRGAAINFKSKVVDGETMHVPYEACITWAQAVLSPEETAAIHDESLSDAALAAAANRMVASQSFVLAAPHCVPADYLGAIAVCLNDDDTARITEHHRNKNRGPIEAEYFERALGAPETALQRLIRAVFERKRRLLQVRREHPAFSPHATCEVGVATGSVAVYSVMRCHRGETVLALTNASAIAQEVQLPPGTMQDLLSGTTVSGAMRLAPHQVAWLHLAER